jgi:hypothetical protein
MLIRKQVQISLLISVMLMGVAHALSPPKPAVSEYMRSTGAGFAMSPEDGIQYAMTFAIERPLGESIYVAVLFENPQKGGAPLRKDVTLASDAKEFSIKSDRLKALHNNKKYLVEVQLYSDESRSKLTSIHKQEVLFSVPRSLLDQFQQQYGIRID